MKKGRNKIETLVYYDPSKPNRMAYYAELTIGQESWLDSGNSRAQARRHLRAWIHRGGVLRRAGL